MYQNRISLIGFTGTDPQIRGTKNNRTYAVLSVATKRSWLNKQTGERVSITAGVESQFVPTKRL